MKPTKILRTNLVTLATAYAKATKTSLPAVSKKFYGNVGFFDAFKAGETSISIDKYGDVVDAFKGEWPDGVEWPFLRAVIIESPRPR